MYIICNDDVSLFLLQLDTLQTSSVKDEKGTQALIHRLQSQLVDIQRQVLQTHHQQQQLKASPRTVPPQLPDPLSPQGGNLMNENMRPRRHCQGVTSQRLQVIDNLNVTARSDSSSDASSASTGKICYSCYLLLLISYC